MPKRDDRYRGVRPLGAGKGTQAKPLAAERELVYIATASVRSDIDGSALGRRDDDDRETVRRRLAVYHEQTEPLIEFYGDRQRLLRIDGEGHPSKIHRRLAAAITAATDRARTSTIAVK